MNNLKDLGIDKWFETNHEKKISGRYITFPKIKPLIDDLSEQFYIQRAGSSFKKTGIFKIEIGSGEKKILLWSQMHGNESSGTKAIFDFFKFIQDPGELSSVRDEIFRNCTLVFIPLLNPDGAEAYTRVNAQQIDLNRDAVDLKAPESRVLRSVLNDFKPGYCFNLHDQRTLFTTGKPGKTATISFLAPSEGEDRAVTEGRKETMRVISAMNDLLQEYIPGQIGRYTDEFYPSATGDNFQKEGYHTILIESGHHKGDYLRESTRKYTFIALLQGIYSIAQGLKGVKYTDYFTIPENTKNHFDLLLERIVLKGEVTDAGILFKEELTAEGEIKLIPNIEKTGDLNNYIADRSISGKGLFFTDQTELIAYIKKYTHLL